jgi:hypothetical protein
MPQTIWGPDYLAKCPVFTTTKRVPLGAPKYLQI